MEPVFVSSTFVDLQTHREVVRNLLRQAGFIDLSMEDLGARDERPLNECLRIVKEESEYFVGIYAHRYGYVPKEISKSITEAEYEVATDANLPRFIYLVDPGIPWIPSYIDSGDAAEKLQRFKEQLKERHICAQFTSADSLASKVVADLGRESRRKHLKRVNRANGEPPSAENWTNQRDLRYHDRRFLNLVHVIEPSADPNQEYDILIYLFRHRDNEQSSPFGLDDVVRAEFFLGPFWGNRVFPCANTGRHIGISVSAYGSFLCLCKVTFTDGAEIVLDRYIDFENRRMSLATPNQEC